MLNLFSQRTISEIPSETSKQYEASITVQQECQESINIVQG
jgi:hypothetical protein